MYINKNFGVKGFLQFSGGHLIWLTAWAVGYAIVYEYTNVKWLTIPWVPLAVIGTAVAFYVGFKNNSAYARMWEARKIWGEIINSSRMWGANVRAYVCTHFTGKDYSDSEIQKIHKVLISRHIAWCYTLRSQLLIPTPWEHIQQGRHVGRITKKRMKTFGIGLFDDEITEMELKSCLPK